jgi:VWFA-related protein
MRLSLYLITICMIGAAQAQDEIPTFKTRVNLVSVPVVVRDRWGKAVGNLEKADFQLFDRGKPQVISRFSVEIGATRASTPAPVLTTGKDEIMPAIVAQPIPDRFVAYLFDDIHLAFGDMVYVRDAAARHLEALAQTDRAAIYTTSGQTMQDFTSDRDLLQAVLKRLSPRPMARRSFSDCPDLPYYMANQIINRNDPLALQTATTETMGCARMDRRSAEVMARGAAQRVVSENEHEMRVTLSVLRDVVRRMSTTPGQRTIVLASPGFIAPENQRDKSEIIDRAIRANIIINAIDGRGLWTDSIYDASRPGGNFTVMNAKNQYERAGVSMQADVLAEMAAGTGGTFFQNSNDLDDGFKRVAAAPEFYYVLGFSPEDLKMDGSFHNLKVQLNAKKGLTALARKGYYAPKTIAKPEDRAKEEIRDAIFSREEMNDVPVTLRSEFVKQSTGIAAVTVAVEVDIRSLRYRKVDGRNHNNVTVIVGIFDGNGNRVDGVDKLVEMRLKDETLADPKNPGFTMRSTFNLAAGSYLVRLVVRDSEGEQMSARNGVLDIR